MLLTVLIDFDIPHYGLHSIRVHETYYEEKN